MLDHHRTADDRNLRHTRRTTPRVHISWWSGRQEAKLVDILESEEARRVLEAGDEEHEAAECQAVATGQEP